MNIICKNKTEPANGLYQKNVCVKTFLCAACALCMLFPAFSQSAYMPAYTPHRVEAVDTRSEGFGGFHFADTESVYSLFSNPATLSFIKTKMLWPPFVAVSSGGPFNKLAKLHLDIARIVNAKDVDPADKQRLIKAILDTIGPSGFNLFEQIGTPLTFGRINKNLGWGFINTVYADARVPALTNFDIKGGSDWAFVLGYAIPAVDLEKWGTLSLGCSGRFTVQLETQAKRLDPLLSGKYGKDPDIAIPVYLSLGLGFDMGVQYTVFDILTLALVWQDVYSPVWTKTYESTKAFENGKGSKFVQTPVESKLGAGIKVDIPLKTVTNGVISRWAVYTDYYNVWPLFRKNGVYRNPVLEFSLGTEMELFKVLVLRLGVKEMYPALGLGLNLGKFKMDFSAYGKELGLEPGYAPQLNMGFSMAVKY